MKKHYRGLKAVIKGFLDHGSSSSMITKFLITLPPQVKWGKLKILITNTLLKMLQLLPFVPVGVPEPTPEIKTFNSKSKLSRFRKQ